MIVYLLRDDLYSWSGVSPFYTKKHNIILFKILNFFSNSKHSCWTTNWVYSGVSIIQRPYPKLKSKKRLVTGTGVPPKIFPFVPVIPVNPRMPRKSHPGQGGVWPRREDLESLTRWSYSIYTFPNPSVKLNLDRPSFQLVLCLLGPPFGPRSKTSSLTLFRPRWKGEERRGAELDFHAVYYTKTEANRRKLGFQFRREVSSLRTYSTLTFFNWVWGHLTLTV